MGKVFRTVLFGGVMLAAGYLIAPRGGSDNYSVQEQGDKIMFYDKEAGTKEEMVRIDDKTFFADPVYNLEGFVKTSALEQLEETYSKREQKGVLKDMKKKAEDTLDDVFEKFR